MRRYIKGAIIITIIFGLYYCTSESNPSQPGGGTVPNAANFYPGGLGTSLQYKVDTLNRNTNMYDSVGTRTSTFDRMEVIDSTQYIVQVNNTVVDTLMLPGELRFRRTSNGIYFFIDTTGFSEVVPDSLIQQYQLTISIDDEFNGFSSQALSSGSWNAFKLNISVGTLITISVVDVAANYLGEENIFIKQTRTNAKAKKIEYKIKLSIPNPNNPTQFDVQEYTATGWYVENIGLVRLRGNGLLVNTITTGTIDFADTTKSIDQTLGSYNIL